MFVKWVRDLQPSNECECRDVLIATENLCELALEKADVGFETVTLPHLYEEEAMVILFCLPTRCVLSEERFGYLLEVMERLWRQGVEPI